MILNNIYSLIEEGSLQRRLGIRFKTIVDPKTGKSHLFQVVRGRINGGLAIHPTSSSISSRFDIPTNFKRKANFTPKVTYKTGGGDRQFPTILVPDTRGRTHPAGFYHEVGHELRNTPNMGTIRQEKTAWQGAKELRPDLYDMAKKDGELQKAFGSYVNNKRSGGLATRIAFNNLGKIPNSDPSKLISIGALNTVLNPSEMNPKRALIDYTNIQKARSNAVRSDIVKAVKLARPVARKNQKHSLSQLIKAPKQSWNQINRYDQMGWL